MKTYSKFFCHHMCIEWHLIMDFIFWSNWTMSFVIYKKYLQNTLNFRVVEAELKNTYTCGEYRNNIHNHPFSIPWSKPWSIKFGHVLPKSFYAISYIEFLRSPRQLSLLYCEHILFNLTAQSYDVVCVDGDENDKTEPMITVTYGIVLKQRGGWYE